MTFSLRGIDHAVIAVHDLDLARDTYRRLGFTLSRRGVHSASMGTANHTIMLMHDYFELLTVVASTERNLLWRDALAVGEGIAGIALATDDAAAVLDAWREADISPGEIMRFVRPVERLDGAVQEARFVTAPLSADAVPGVAIFVCQHLTPELVWLPELLDHANSAHSIRGVTIATPDPERAATKWARVLSPESASQVEGGVQLRAGPHLIKLMRMEVDAPPGGPAGAAPSKAIGIEFAVRNVDACRRSLASGNIPFSVEGGSTSVAPDSACGVAIRFVDR